MSTQNELQASYKTASGAERAAILEQLQKINYAARARHLARAIEIEDQKPENVKRAARERIATSIPSIRSLLKKNGRVRITKKRGESLAESDEWTALIDAGVVCGPYFDLGYHGARRVAALAKSLGHDIDAHLASAGRDLSSRGFVYTYERREGYFNNVKTYEIRFDDRDIVCYVEINN